MGEHTGPEHMAPKVTYLIPILNLSFFTGLWLQGIHLELENQHMCRYKHYYITNSDIRQPNRHTSTLQARELNFAIPESLKRQAES